MKSVTLGILMLIGVMILAAVSTVVRRKLVINVNSYPKIVSMVFSWPFFILVGMLVFTFVLNFVANYYLDVPQALIASWALAFPTFLLSAGISNIWLGETFKSSQWGALGIMIIGTTICCIGAFMYFLEGAG